MTESYEFIPDLESPVLGKPVHLLKLDPVSESSQHPKQLVKWHAAKVFNHRGVLEPGKVGGCPGARVLKSWPARGPEGTVLPLERAVGRSRWEQPQILAVSASCGRLLVTTCLGMAMDSEGVVIPSARDPEISLHDLNRGVSFGGLVRYHLDRLDTEGIDPLKPLDAGVDELLVSILEAIPESMARA